MFSLKAVQSSDQKRLCGHCFEVARQPSIRSLKRESRFANPCRSEPAVAHAFRVDLSHPIQQKHKMYTSHYRCQF